MAHLRVGRSPAAPGQASVELVLVLPFVVLVLLLVLQVGLVVRSQVLVVHAAREGARAAAVEHGSASVARHAARGTPGLVPARVHVVAQRVVDALPRVRVAVSYRMPTDVALVGPLLCDPVLRAQVVMLIEEPLPPP